jgi:hypothetical protein
MTEGVGAEGAQIGPRLMTGLTTLAPIQAQFQKVPLQRTEK